MAGALAGLVVAIVGGDQREREVAWELGRQGARVRVATGASWAGEERRTVPWTVHDGVGPAVTGADVIIGPLAGADGQGQVWSRPQPAHPLLLSPAVLAGAAAGARLFIGNLGPPLADWAVAAGVLATDLNRLDDLALYNAIPTAEGAVAVAMAALPVTIAGVAAAILGGGRVGSTLAGLLVRMGAEATVVDRQPARRAQAATLGCRVEPWERLLAVLSRAQVVFNTVPAPVIADPALRSLGSGVPVIELASAPGGVDRVAARLLGVTVIDAPGLPGRVAPVTAGRYLAAVLVGLLAPRGGGCAAPAPDPDLAPARRLT